MEGVVAQVVTAVEDAAGHRGILVEPGTDGEDGDPCSGPFRLGEHGLGDGGLALAVEGERDAGAATGAVCDLGRLPGEGEGCRGMEGPGCGGPGRGACGAGPGRGRGRGGCAAAGTPRGERPGDGRAGSCPQCAAAAYVSHATI